MRGEWATWDGEWRGWWGDEPPYHAPVFVLTHHEHHPIEMAGGTTFHFVTGRLRRGVRPSSRRRRRPRGRSSPAAPPRSGRRSAAGVLDEIVLDVAPVLLGGGERLLDGVADPGLTPVEVIASPLATHIRYRVGS